MSGDPIPDAHRSGSDPARRSMSRRAVLAGLSGVGAGTIGGCLGDTEPVDVDRPTVVADRPDAVYYPSHVEAMETIGTKRAGGRTIALMYTHAHRFWTILNGKRQLAPVDNSEIHLMVSVWDRKTRTVLPVDSGLEFKIFADGDLVVQRAPWPMLAQPMGFHLGDNIRLRGSGDYRVRVTTGSLDSLALEGTFDGRFQRSRTVEFDFSYSIADRNEIPIHVFPDRAGELAAVTPTDLGMPLSVAPPPEALPGDLLGQPTSGDAVLVTTLADASDGSYISVSPRTPYNGYVLPMLNASVTVDRDGSTVFDGPLEAAIGPNRSYHYRAFLEDIQSGDEVTVEFHTVPQVARHEGYETAFLSMPPSTVTIP